MSVEDILVTLAAFKCASNIIYSLDNFKGRQRHFYLVKNCRNVFIMYITHDFTEHSLCNIKTIYKILIKPVIYIYMNLQ